LGAAIDKAQYYTDTGSIDLKADNGCDVRLTYCAAACTIRFSQLRACIIRLDEIRERFGQKIAGSNLPADFGDTVMNGCLVHAA
jgi:hypothetical protein